MKNEKLPYGYVLVEINSQNELTDDHYYIHKTGNFFPVNLFERDFNLGLIVGGATFIKLAEIPDGYEINHDLKNITDCTVLPAIQKDGKFVEIPMNGDMRDNLLMGDYSCFLKKKVYVNHLDKLPSGWNIVEDPKAIGKSSWLVNSGTHKDPWVQVVGLLNYKLSALDRGAGIRFAYNPEIELKERIVEEAMKFTNDIKPLMDAIEKFKNFTV